MNWYAAHIVMMVRLKSANQERFPVWENIVLVQANSLEKAFAKAEEAGRREEGDEEGEFTWGGRSATWMFAGVRKLTVCTFAEERPGDGEEITYNELEFASERDVKRFATGKATSARRNDLFRSPRTGKANNRPKAKT